MPNQKTRPDDSFLNFPVNTNMTPKQGESLFYSTGTAQWTNSPAMGWDGWIPQSLTWSRTGNHTISMTGNQTGTYQKGAKLWWRDSGQGNKYGVVGNVNTNLISTTLNLIPNNDYIASGTITDHYVSYIENPFGFPDWFGYTSTLGGFSGTPSQTSRFRISARGLEVFLDISGTSNSTDFTATMPAVIQSFANIFLGGFRAVDNSVPITATVPACVISAGATTITFYKDWGAAPWTNSGTKAAQITTIVEY